MRRGYDGSIIRDETGQFVGVDLGADFCAEHEWGIRRLKQLFGIGEGAEYGVASCKMTHLPNMGMLETFPVKLGVFENGYYRLKPKERPKINGHALAFFGGWRTDPMSIPDKLKVMQIGDVVNDKEAKAGVVGSWSEGDFGFVILHEKAEKYVKDMVEAFAANDIAFMFGTGHVFKNRGLIIAIASRLPKEVDVNLTQQHFDNLELQAVSDATGIVDKLEAASKAADTGSYRFNAPCTYYALSPRWKDESKTEVIYWLNPRDQQNNNYGWFTVADLEAWIEGKGPIPKTELERRK